MADSNAPAANGVGRHPPGNDGTFVAGHIITVFRFQIPVFGFLQAGVTGGIQQLADYLNLDRSALSKELGKMRDDGLIRCRKNEFELCGTE